jgi:hypothetical protein
MKFHLTQIACIGVLSFAALGAQAATDREKTIKNQYNAAMSQADADYKLAMAGCDGKLDNDKDVCVQQAKTNRDKSKADARTSRKTQEAMADNRGDRAEADYKVAKEKCDALSGDAKDSCVANAKLRYNQ